MNSSKSSSRAKKTTVTLVLFSILVLSANLFAATPKYIFLFIGDGMGTSQRFAAQKYYEAISSDSQTENPLAINTLPVHGLTTTFCYDAMVTDSAAAATALATGQKTRSKTVSMDINKITPVKTIAEKAKENGRKVGIVTSVSIDHATPAAFYAHQPSRYNYYEIAMSMSKSDFDYFAGGYPKGATEKYSKDKANPIDALKENGYNVISNRKQFDSLLPKDGKTFVYNELSKDICSLEYVIDSKPSHFKLAEFTAKGVQMLDNPEGFFMMVEGGRIDWSCHSNDAATTVKEIKAFDDAVRVALDFYKRHPEETLIVVTGDHETGGMVFSHSGDNAIQNKLILSKQSCSIGKFINHFSKFKKTDPDFQQVTELLEEELGLKDLTDTEREKLQKAYNASFSDKGSKNKILYGVYDPLAITAIHLLSQRAGIEWTTYSHTGVPVSTTAIGVQSQIFNGFYDNTDLSNKLASLIVPKKSCAK